MSESDESTILDIELNLEEYELFLERAAIMEFDGGMSREEANRRALEDCIQYFQVNK